MIEDSEFHSGLTVAWGLLNDSYQTNLCIRHPPYLIALGCIYVAAVLMKCEAELRPWFTSLNTEMKDVRCPLALFVAAVCVERRSSSADAASDRRGCK